MLSYRYFGSNYIYHIDTIIWDFVFVLGGAYSHSKQSRVKVPTLQSHTPNVEATEGGSGRSDVGVKAWAPGPGAGLRLWRFELSGGFVDHVNWRFLLPEGPPVRAAVQLECCCSRLWTRDLSVEASVFGLAPPRRRTRSSPQSSNAQTTTVRLRASLPSTDKPDSKTPGLYRSPRALFSLKFE